MGDFKFSLKWLLHRNYNYCTNIYPHFLSYGKLFLSVVHFKTIQNNNCQVLASIYNIHHFYKMYVPDRSRRIHTIKIFTVRFPWIINISDYFFISMFTSIFYFYINMHYLYNISSIILKRKCKTQLSILKPAI